MNENRVYLDLCMVEIGSHSKSEEVEQQKYHLFETFETNDFL